MAGGGAGDKAAAELRSTIDFVAAELAVLFHFAAELGPPWPVPVFTGAFEGECVGVQAFCSKVAVKCLAPPPCGAGRRRDA